MSRIFVSLFIASTAVVGLAAAVAADPDAHKFRVTIQSQLTMTIAGKPQVLDADTELRYTWTRAGQEKVLTFDSLQTKATLEKKTILDSAMSRAKIKSGTDGGVSEVLFADATPEVQQLLKDTFEMPLCKIAVDEHGVEVKRTVVAGVGAKSAVNNGMIANALLFHPPFHTDKNEWQVERELSMGNGGYAKGLLTYKKPGDNSGVYAVNGTLANALFQPAGNPLTLKDARYNVKGQQTFDAKRRAWSAGKLLIDVSFSMFQDDAHLGDSAGMMTLMFERLDTK